MTPDATPTERALLREVGTRLYDAKHGHHTITDLYVWFNEALPRLDAERAARAPEQHVHRIEYPSSCTGCEHLAASFVANAPEWMRIGAARAEPGREDEWDGLQEAIDAQRALNDADARIRAAEPPPYSTDEFKAGWHKAVSASLTAVARARHRAALEAHGEPQEGERPRYVSLDDAGPGFLSRNPDYQGEPIVEPQEGKR